MKIIPHSPCLLALLSVCLFLSTGYAQHGHHGGLPKTFHDSIPLYPEALGPLTWEVSTENSLAQDYFNQGVQLKYAFAVNEAARSFREARKLDPECVACYWGEAWALGSYLNEPMSEAKAPLALEAAQTAKKLAKKHGSELEKALVAAIQPRYIKDYDPETRALQDTAYAKAMEKVYQQYPDHHEIATVYAEALFLLEPRRGTRDVADPDVVRLHKILEKVLDEDIEHPGACHLYIHATESSQKPELAATCADYLGSAIPGASHINHMPSHTWNEIGNWGGSVRANLQAWQSDEKAKSGQGIAIYPAHNLHMLLFAACYDGQGAIAMQAAKDYAKRTDNSMYEVLTAIRFGRFDEVLAHEERPERTISGAMWDFAKGYAHLKSGEEDFAKVYLQRVLTTADTCEAEFRMHPARHILGVLGGILEGEIHWMADEEEKAFAAYERAVMIEDSMEYDEPEPIPFAARHWLGAAQMDMEQYEEAAQTYEEELADHPKNGWSLYGLREALKAARKDSKEVDERFQKAWARADHWIYASKY
ncbi:MAG: hypothetical protein AAGC85_25815 [Bacteroidota bacterium]